MGSRLTIADVARHAGVAVGTASDALNGKGRVSEATRTRVQTSATELGFKPHRAARVLPSGRTMAIGIRFPNGGMLPPSGFFVGLLNGVARAAGERGYSVVVSIAEVDERGLVDGLVVVDPWRDDAGSALLDGGLPVVTVGRALGGPPIPSVDVDQAQAVTLLLDHLLPRRHGDGPVVLISLAERPSFVVDMEAAFTSWCDDRGLPSAILRGADAAGDEVHALRGELEAGRTPSMLITAFDRPAAAARWLLTELGHESTPVGSVSDGDSLTYLRPPVSAIAADAEGQGRAAAEMLLDWITDAQWPADRRLAVDLIAR